MTDLDRAKNVAANALPSNLGDVSRAIQIMQSTLYGVPNRTGVMLKLREEVDELAEAIEANDGEAARAELADVLFLVLDMARSLGMTPSLLAEVAHGKLMVNLERDWRQGDDGRWSHVKWLPLGKHGSESLTSGKRSLATVIWWDELQAWEWSLYDERGRICDQGRCSDKYGAKVAAREALHMRDVKGGE